MNDDERQHLDAISVKTDYSRGLNGLMIEHSALVFSRWLLPGSILELGPADGLSTAHLSRLTGDYTVVEGSSEYAKALMNRFSGIEIHNTLFEDFAPNRKYTNIVMGHVLEHVENPTEIVQRAIEWIEVGGRIVAATPNANSLHRQIAARAGLISDIHEVTPTDLSIGHRRVLDTQQLLSYFSSDDLRVVAHGGYYLKSFSNMQIEQIASRDVQEALMSIGEQFPDIAADIYVVVERL